MSKLSSAIFGFGVAAILASASDIALASDLSNKTTAPVVKDAKSQTVGGETGGGLKSADSAPVVVTFPSQPGRTQKGATQGAGAPKKDRKRTTARPL